MQAQLAQKNVRVAVPRQAARPALRVVCQAQKQNKVAQLAKKVAAASVALPALIAANPAFALVDERMNGDGTSLVFGVNTPVLAWVIGGVLTTTWTLYFISQKDLGDAEDEDAGLSL